MSGTALLPTDRAFPSDLDPVLQGNDAGEEKKRIGGILKLSLLFCRQVALTDTHLLDNRGFHRLLRDSDFQDFLEDPGPNNVGPLIAYLRPMAKSKFETSLDDLVNARTQFSILSKDFLNTKLYTPTKKHIALDEVCELSLTEGIDFRYAVDILQRTLWRAGNIVTWNMPYDRYPKLTLVFLNELWDSYDGKTSELAGKLRDELLEALEHSSSNFHGFGYPTRSDLYTIVKKCPSPMIQQQFKRIFLDPPYRINFPLSHGLNPGSSFSFQNDLTETARSIAADAYIQGQVLKENDILLEWNQPILEQLTWEQLHKIRDKTFFENLDYIESAAKVSSPQKVQKALSEHIKHLDHRTRELLPKESIYKPPNKVVVGLTIPLIAGGITTAVYGAFFSGDGLAFSLGNAILTVKDATPTVAGGITTVIGALTTIVGSGRGRRTKGYTQFKVTLDTASKQLRDVLGKPN